MYKEIFVALCLVAMISAYPAENVENEEPIVDLVQVEPDTNGQGAVDDDDQAGDLATDESRYWGGYGHRRHYGHHHHHGGWGYGGYGGYGGYRRGWGGYGGYWG